MELTMYDFGCFVPSVSHAHRESLFYMDVAVACLSGPLCSLTAAHAMCIQFRFVGRFRNAGRPAFSAQGRGRALSPVTN